MAKILTVAGVRQISNVIIAVVILFGVLQIATKTHTLLSSPEEINIIKLDVPWCHPADNVSILLDQNALAQNPRFYQRVQTGFFTFDLIERTISILLLVLILILLRRLLIVIYQRAFFDSRSMTIIRQLSLVVIVYVVCKFLFYQLIPLVVPVDLMIETVNFTTLGESILENLMAALDFKMLFVGICLYVISEAFKEGYELKKESELTI
jgi:hypothetical protein